MSYKNEWFLLEADDNIDEIEHREPTEEFLFYRAVATGDIETVRKNCEAGRFVEGEGVGVLSRDPVVNLKYHFVITTAMITRLCRQNGMELEQAFRMSDFYIRKLDDIHTEAEVHWLWILRKRCANMPATIQIQSISTRARNTYIHTSKKGLR